MTTGCPHPESAIVILRDDGCGNPAATWCSLCGSVRDRVGLHDAPAGTWREPDGLLLPGWTCRACRCFNGSAKTMLTECRHCDAPRIA